MERRRTLRTVFLLCMGLHAHASEGISTYATDPWLFSPNAAGLTRYAADHLGTAELSLTKSKGGLTDFNGSPDILSVNASVESFFRLNTRAVVYGRISYTNFSGRDMTGSAFIQSLPATASGAATPCALQPGLLHSSRHLPFDIVEDSLTNPGTKHQDTYHLTGGLGYDLYKGFALGARLDYTAANYAKYKDLRHKNKLMDMNLTAGFYLPLTFNSNTTLNLGANYQYHRTTESLQFSTYGKSEKVYNSLIAYANFMGHVEQFGNNGYTDKSREMPLVSDYNGVGVQLNLQASAFSFYNSFSYSHRQGYYGRRSPYTITYTGHESDIYHYDARLSATSLCGSRFSLDFSLTAENLQNDAANYREQQNEQGATYYEYYDPLKTANKLWVDGTIAFTADLGTATAGTIHDDGHRYGRFSLRLPAWTLQAGLNWHHRKQTAYAFPFARRQKLTSKEPFVAICRNLAAKRNDACWTFTLHASFREGSGQPFEDLTYQPPSDKQELPATMDAFLWREYQWLTSPQYEVGGSVKYSFIPSFAPLRAFARAEIGHRKANVTNEYSQGCDRTTATLTVGCNF